MASGVLILGTRGDKRGLQISQAIIIGISHVKHVNSQTPCQTAAFPQIIGTVPGDTIAEAMDYSNGHIVIGADTSDDKMLSGTTNIIPLKPLLILFQITSPSVVRLWGKWIDIAGAIDNVALSSDSSNIIAHYNTNYILMVDSASGNIIYSR